MRKWRLFCAARFSLSERFSLTGRFLFLQFNSVLPSHGADCMCGVQTISPAHCVCGRLSHLQTACVVYRLSHPQTAWCTHCLTCRLRMWCTHCLTCRLRGVQTVSPADCVVHILSHMQICGVQAVSPADCVAYSHCAAPPHTVAAASMDLSSESRDKTLGWKQSVEKYFIKIVWKRISAFKGNRKTCVKHVENGFFHFF